MTYSEIEGLFHLPYLLKDRWKRPNGPYGIRTGRKGVRDVKNGLGRRAPFYKIILRYCLGETRRMGSVCLVSGGGGGQIFRDLNGETAGPGEPRRPGADHDTIEADLNAALA